METGRPNEVCVCVCVGLPLSSTTHYAHASLCLTGAAGARGRGGDQAGPQPEELEELRQQLPQGEVSSSPSFVYSTFSVPAISPPPPFPTPSVSPLSLSWLLFPAILLVGR